MSDEKFIPCGPWLPDQADFRNPGSTVAQNVVPRTKTTYSPMPSFAASASSALNSKPLGAFSAVDASGNAVNFVGTTTKLYALSNGSKPNFADVSGATYATPSANFWSFTEAQGYVFATNGFNTLQRRLTASGNFAAIGGNTPVARLCTYIQPGFLLLGDINDPTVGIKPQGLRWSALGDPSDFPLVGGADAIAKSSDWQNVNGPHGRLMGFAPDLASCNAAVFFEQAVFRMVFTGTESIFAIQPVEKLRGTLAARSIVQVGQVAYFLSPNGFFAFDGTVATPIGEGQVNKTFFADADPNYLAQVSGAADPVSGLCFWSYAGTGNTTGYPNRILIYSPLLRRWALITDVAGHNLFIARTQGTSLDGLDALGYTLDTLPFSLDDAALAGGRIVLGGFDSSFKFGTFSGPNMAYTVDTTEVQLAERGRARVSGARPAVEGDTCSVAIAGRGDLQGAVVFGTANAVNADGFAPARSEGRYHRARLTAAAGNLTTHIQGAELIFSPAGSR